jgi:hypothetical protein
MRLVPTNDSSYHQCPCLRLLGGKRQFRRLRLLGGKRQFRRLRLLGEKRQKRSPDGQTVRHGC